MTQQAFTIEQFVDSFNLGRTKVYEEIAAGRLATYQVGRRRYISAQAAATWQQQREEESRPVKAGAEAAA